MPAALTTDQLRHAAEKLPRVPLAHLPTPLEDIKRFTRELGGPRVLIKRDDCTGMVMGGNKTRHNEFLFGEALKQNADCLVWGAGVQSNNCRQTAAACNKLGLECHLFLSRAVHNDDIQGNLLLDHLLGAKVTIIDTPMGPELDDMLLAKAKELRAAGRRPFVWDRITGRPIAAVSYALALAEIFDQARARGIEPTHVYAAAAGATGGGLAIGKAILGWPGKVRLLCPIRWPWDTPKDLAEVANQTATLLGLPHRIGPADIDIRDDYMGPRYGAVTPAGREAMNLLARTEGILLDPVYTAKAMAGLIDDARNGRLGKADTAVFIHTGGTPAIFAYRDELMGQAAH
ncbi:MAG TPA: D-cysteine desulfhydrase family protein [Gemmataceae bacterium]|nr:D-cysteine desulfhydrase family protein [Gemmataceae bacterium]